MLEICLIQKKVTFISVVALVFSSAWIPQFAVLLAFLSSREPHY